MGNLGPGRTRTGENFQISNRIDAKLFGFLVSKIMAKVVEEEGTDLVIVGKQSIDGDYGQTAQMLATQLDWAQGTSLYSVSSQILEFYVLNRFDLVET